MRKFLQWLFSKPIIFLAEKLSSAPDKKVVFSSLSHLLKRIHGANTTKGVTVPFDLQKDRFIVFSDQHKGTRDAADDFRLAEPNYLAALKHYHDQEFVFISLGDCEELWKYTPEQVMACNAACFDAEKKFMDNDRYYRIFGNHDLAWKFALQRDLFLKPVFGRTLQVFEGLVLQTMVNDKTYRIFLAHGHQGDKRNDGNRFSIWVVASIWTPIQRYLHISINTPATSFALTDKHNIIMHEWSARQPNLLFISGHTHKPVFASMDHVDKLAQQMDAAKTSGDAAAIAPIKQELDKRKIEYAGKKQISKPDKPSYFNSGCCCFEDGDITGIEVEGGCIRLIKWNQNNGVSQRTVLEEAPLQAVFEQLG